MFKKSQDVKAEKSDLSNLFPNTFFFRLLNDAEIAKSKRDFELKKAAYDVEVQTKKAEAELAYELQAAKTKQRIKDEQMQIKVVERTQEILVQVQFFVFL